MKNSVQSLRARLVATFAVAGLVAAGLATVTLAPPIAAHADPVDPTAEHALRLVAKYPGVWMSPPAMNMSSTADGPLMGNGDVGVALGGAADALTAYLGKNEFFSATDHFSKPVGRIAMSAPGFAGATYKMVQDIANAEVRGEFTASGATLNTTSWMAATDNVYVMRMELTGGSAQNVSFTLQTGTGAAPAAAPVVSGDVLSQDYPAAAGKPSPIARVSTKVIGATPTISGRTMTVTLVPGNVYTLVSAIISDKDSGTWQTTAADKATSLTQPSVDALNADHRSWWEEYYSKSFVEIPDKAIERAWYSSVYLMGTASREGEAPPALWGPWNPTNSMPWSNYHLNYNYQLPFMGMIASNHIAQSNTYEKPIFDYIPAARAFALSQSDDDGPFTGLMYPVGISTEGTSAYPTIRHGQKSNAAYAAMPMITKFYNTYDLDYAEDIYPFLKEVGTFWEDDLEWDAALNRWMIQYDAPQEAASGTQTNSIAALGLVKLLFQGLVDISEATGQDATKRLEWQSILDDLSDFPTVLRSGQTIFSQSEDGLTFVNSGNDVNIQHIFPASQIALNSSASDLQIAHNTINQLTNAWHGGNAPSTFYTAMARVGFDPARVLREMHKEAASYIYANGHIRHQYGGLENVSVVGSGLPEMLLQSVQNDVKVFASWPRGTTDAKFGDLRAFGAFLVSSAVEDDVVQYLRIISEKGRPLTITNPWPGSDVQVYRDGVAAEVLDEPADFADIDTATDETLHFAPAGTTLSEIETMMSEPLSGPRAGFGLTTGFEATDPLPTWADALESGANVSGPVNVPIADLRAESKHAGTSALLFAGKATAATENYAYSKVFDLTSSPLVVDQFTSLSYWIYPQTSAQNSYATGTNSSCVAVDLVFSDGSHLRDSGAVDQDGTSIHPAAQCGDVPMGIWSKVTVDLGASSAGKSITRVLLGYDQPGVAGGYRGYLDDLSITRSVATGFEAGQPGVSWSDKVNGDELSNVASPTASVTTDEAHVGVSALAYSGVADGDAENYAYLRSLDLSESPYTVDPTSSLSYWIYPESSTANPAVSGTNSTCVAVDLVFSDGTRLRNSAAVDQDATSIHPASQCGQLTLDTWNKVTVALGSTSNGKKVTRVLIGYDQPGASGGYAGYIDDFVLGKAPFAGTSFETGQPALTWVSAVDGSNILNVTGFCCGLTAPVTDIRTERKRTGSVALMYGAAATGGVDNYAYMKLFDVAQSQIVVGSATTLSYWVYPQSSTQDSRITGDNSTCVALDIVFTDGTTLRDSGTVDNTGDPATAAGQCSHLTKDTWNQVSINLGTNNLGKTLSRILLDYNQPGGTGGYRGYVDDIAITG